MLPGEDAVVCGELLAAPLAYTVLAGHRHCHRLQPLRAAGRGRSQRKTLLVFDGCYHGTLDDVMALTATVSGAYR
jgi:glutamate-1-semialdehyde 2,1-aminomutase